ncbi:MAG TPA: type II toxin-antitoxin system PemK/MazF family toxin [Longimicrobium sp.]|jgi:mRNA interferase MazF
MAYIGPVRRWDVFWADLEPVVGREQAGRHRPVLVMSSDQFSGSTLRLAMIIPLTSKEGKTRAFHPFEIPLPKGMISEGITPLAMTHQLRTVSTLRLLQYAGRLETEESRERIEDAVLAHLGIALDE